MIDNPVLFIGEAVLGGTSGSIPYVDSNNLLAQDNSNLFWDASNIRLGIGTNTPASKLEIMCSSATEIGLLLQTAASPTGAIQSIINSAGTNITSYFTSVASATSRIQRYFTDGITFPTGNVIVLSSLDTTIEVSGGAGFSYVATSGTFNINGLLSGFGTGVIFFNFSPTINFKSGSVGALGLPIFFNSMDIFADGITNMACNWILASFHDSPTFGIKNSGSFEATASYKAFSSDFLMNSGTLDVRRSYVVTNAGGSGTINTQVGLDVESLTKGGTSNIAIRTGSSGVIEIGNKITKYNNIATVSNGVPSELATVDLTTQSAAIAATTIYTPTATGLYRISVYLQVTRAATTSSVLGGATGVVITYNDGDGNVAQSDTVALATTAGAIAINAAGNTTATNLNGSIIIYARTGVNIQYAIGYTSVGITSMQYAAHLKLEAL